MALCPLELESDPFAGIAVEDFPVRKAIIFVKGTERSHMDKLGDQRKKVTPETCAFDEWMLWQERSTRSWRFATRTT